MRGRHRPRRNYQLRIFLLSLVIVLISPIVGNEALDLSKAIAKSDLIAELTSGVILLACLGVIFLLAWAIMLQKKKQARSRNER